MNLENNTLIEFIDALASSESYPGGGGASALIGAIGTALGGMVASLTVGKKTYADVESEISALQAKCTQIQKDFLELINRDAEGFAPLARAYHMPTNTEEQKQEKARVLEIESANACKVPLEIMEKCCVAIEAVEVFAAKGSKLALSDAGVAALFCKAAMEGASLNVYINTKSMQDRKKADQFNKRADDMITTYGVRAQKVYDAVLMSLKGQV